VPEGDALHRAARRLQPLVGQRLEVESPNPRAQATRVAARVDGRVLESVEAVGKNLLLRFEGGLVVRSHLRMTGRWRIEPRGKVRTGLPWLVLRGETLEGVLWNGPVLTLETRNLRRLGQDVLGEEFDLDAAVARLRAAGELWLGEALQDQRLVAGIGNMWMSEALWSVRASPWARVRDVDDGMVGEAVAAARRLMREAFASGRQAHRVYRRAGRPCSRCGTIIRSRGQGDGNRTAYWCPACQAGGGPPGE
jgi:endonuclease VIII